MDTTTEKSTAWLTVNFTDKADAAATPISVSYSIVDEASGTVVRPKQGTTIASEIIIALTVEDNTFVDTNGESEVRVVTVEAAFESGEKNNQQFKYELTRLKASAIL